MEKTTEVRLSIALPPVETTVPQCEAKQRLQKLLKAHGATWDCHKDPSDPYNWPNAQKITIAILYSLGSLVTLMSASMVAPLLKDIMRDLDVDASTAQIVFSTVFLGYGLGPFVLAALSEMYGRRMVWIWSQVLYVVWNTLSPVGNNKVLMIVGRLMAGMCASAGIALVGPVMSDMYPKSNRGRSLAIASFLPYFGPALGPILGGLLAEFVSWKWVFWIMSMFSGFLAIVSTFFIPETYTPALLRRKASLVKFPGAGSDTESTTATASTIQTMPSAHGQLVTNLLRPIKLLVHRPIIQMLSFALGLNFGVYAFFLSTLATLFQGPRYDEDRAHASLHYFSITVAAAIVSLAGSPAMDYVYDALSQHYKAKNEHGIPEYRAPYMVPAVILVGIGIFMYGWAAEKGLHWMVVDIGACILNVGGFALCQGVLAYQLDEFGDYAASAGAASRLLSYLMGFGFPIFAPELYKALGYGWGNSVVGLVWILFGLPVPVILWVWGARLRGIYWGSAAHDGGVY
ncbi:major facilitator superfamily domain containing protein [Naviculisporaceae sp. PSN 640]